MPWHVMLELAVLAGVLLLLVAHEAGFRAGRRALARDGEDAGKGLAVTEGAVFGLLGLLIAFTFSGSVARLDARRALVAEEANAISTSYLRLDLLGPELSAPIRPLYRAYLDQRIAQAKVADDAPWRPGALRAVEAMQARIWAATVAALERKGQPQLAAPVLGPLNAMIDITTTRRMAAMMHPPRLVFVALVVVTVLGALLAGYARGLSGRRSLLHAGIFVLALGGTIYAVVEMEYPRLGLVTIDRADVVLADLRGTLR